MTAQLLRSIPFGDLLASVLVEMAKIEVFYGPGGRGHAQASDPDDGSEPEDWEVGRRTVRQAQDIRFLAHNAGRPPHADAFYRHIAERCLAIHAERPGSGVIKQLAFDEGKPTRRRGAGYA